MNKNTQTDHDRISIEFEGLIGDEQRIFWLSVIMQGLSDALSTSQEEPFKTRREEALKWFEAAEGEDSDLAMICHYAEVDFRKTQKRIRMFINREIPAVDFRCLRKGYTPEPESKKSYFKRLRKQDELKILERDSFNSYRSSDDSYKGFPI